MIFYCTTSFEEPIYVEGLLNTKHCVRSNIKFNIKFVSLCLKTEESFKCLLYVCFYSRQMLVSSPSKSSLYSKPSFQSPSRSHPRVLSCCSDHQPDFLYKNAIYFCFGCAGSLLLQVGFPQLWWRGLLSRCSVGFSVWWLLLLRSMGPRATGSVTAAHRAPRDLPQPGTKPMSCTSRRLSTTGPPRKSSTCLLYPSTTQFDTAFSQL